MLVPEIVVFDRFYKVFWPLGFCVSVGDCEFLELCFFDRVYKVFLPRSFSVALDDGLVSGFMLFQQVL